MNRWRVGEDRGSKEMDQYPLTPSPGCHYTNRCCIAIMTKSKQCDCELVAHWDLW
jgi:hypothetical protein